MSLLTSSARIRRAFTLIELLVVMSILLALSMLVVPAFNTLIGANSVSASADRLADALDLARQSAMTQNKLVEVRFYEVPAPGWPNAFRAFQTFEISSSGVVTPSTKPEILASPTIIASDIELSTLLTSGISKTWSSLDPQVKLPVTGTSYICRYFRFRPDGTTDLAIDKKWHLTVVDAKAPGSAAVPPKNFATVWLEPASGAVRVLRP